MKSTQVKSHKRKGRVVKSHSRAVKSTGKSCGSGMSAEECKAKYDAMVTKYGEDSPQAKKLAMKMESMETVEKNARYPKGKVRASQEKIKAVKDSSTRGDKKPIKKGFKKADMLEAVKKKKHSRGDYMRKNVEDELLTKGARAKKSGSAYSDKQVENMKATADKKRAKTGKAFKSKSLRKKSEVDNSGPAKKSMHDKMAALRAKKK